MAAHQLHTVLKFVVRLGDFDSLRDFDVTHTHFDVDRGFVLGWIVSAIYISWSVYEYTRHLSRHLWLGVVSGAECDFYVGVTTALCVAI